jgi:hypothetical protein
VWWCGKMADVELNMRELERIIRQHPTQADNWLRGVAQQMENEVKLSMTQSPATGNTYSRGRNRTHTASSPGNPPRPDVGALMGSIRSKRRGGLHYEIRDGVEYGVYLEYGTEAIAARPFMRPVFEDWRRKIMRDAKENLSI